MLLRPALSRRSFLSRSAAVGAIGVSGATLTGLAAPARAQSNLPDPQSVLDGISVEKYVREDYRTLYGLDNTPLWDPAKDWIRTVDWEAVRAQHAGTTVRFAIGAADQDSAAAGLVPFEQLSGIKVELVPIPDDSFYDKAVAEFISGNASFDALQFFSPWLGDFAAPGFLFDMSEFAAKWGLPLDDFYDTYRLNYGYFGGKLYGIPFDCDIRQLHVRKSYLEQVLGGPVDRWTSIPTFDDLIRLAGELDGVAPGVSGIGMMGARGFWSTYSWEQIAAHHGMDLFDANWAVTLNSDAGVKALETLLELAKFSGEATAGAGWDENRAGWLGGRYAMNLSWQDSGTQGTRPDQATIVDDLITIYDPRVAGGRFAPTNIAGSTSCVAASAQNPEGAFLMLSFLTTASIMAMNEANANGVAPGYRSVLNNAQLAKASQPLEVWAKALDYAWCAPRLPGMFEMEQALGNEINRAIVGQISPKEALDNGAAAWTQIMERNGFRGGDAPVAYADVAPGLWAGAGKPLPF